MSKNGIVIAVNPNTKVIKLAVLVEDKEIAQTPLTVKEAEGLKSKLASVIKLCSDTGISDDITFYSQKQYIIFADGKVMVAMHPDTTEEQAQSYLDMYNSRMVELLESRLAPGQEYMYTPATMIQVICQTVEAEEGIPGVIVSKKKKSKIIKGTTER